MRHYQHNGKKQENRPHNDPNVTIPEKFCVDNGKLLGHRTPYFNPVNGSLSAFGKSQKQSG
jgi:hypothetical protein